MVLPDEERNILLPISVLKQERNMQNGIIALHSISEAKKGDGVRRDIKAILSQLLSIQSIKNTVQANGNELRLHFAADGRRTSNKIGTVMAVFNILDEQEHDCDHQYHIALYNGKEDYLEVKTCLGPVFAEVDDLQQNGIEVDGIHYKVIWYCCSDWKFLAMAYGLNAATGKYFCLWCHSTKAKICDFSIQDWPIERNLQQCMKNSTEKTTDGRKGSIHEPLISIPFTQVIVDTLHLFLRIMGLLFHQDVTPYIHALVYHVPQFLEKCGGLSIFNCQPVEKKNHQQSRMFHQGTQKGGRKSSYTKQVMEKEYRKIYARVNNLYRTKRTYQSSGHTEVDPGALHLYTHQNLEEG
ncbi:uncharacterized protein LOC111335191 [Stylophora pistillata]|uniref:uncharacterized protein LOC111335191 n=1 Tax=Stylophora pistillata TaxID=50429 RepID=UPI000C04BEB0|nr:uncharacterized protein LOC111335191 [Stylophora pistillata]